MPLSCPVALASQRELHKDGGGGGGVARRARAARAPKAKSCATPCETSSATPCAASFTCPSFMCHLREGVGGGARVRGLAHTSSLDTDLTRNTRAPHFTPQHWLLCHMGLY